MCLLRDVVYVIVPREIFGDGKDEVFGVVDDFNNYDPRASVTTLLQDLNWPTLQHRRQLAKLIMMYHITYHLIEIPSITYLILSRSTVEAYSSHGRTNVLYACVLALCGQFRMLRRRKARVECAFFVMLFT
jgi:hypothetical protein